MKYRIDSDTLILGNRATVDNGSVVVEDSTITYANTQEGAPEVDDRIDKLHDIIIKNDKFNFKMIFQDVNIGIIHQKPLVKTLMYVLHESS